MADAELGAPAETGSSISKQAGCSWLRNWFLSIRDTGSRPSEVPPPAGRKRFDIRSRENYTVDLTVEKALKHCEDHREYTVGAVTLRELGKFDDSTSCGISADAELAMIEQEITKLVEFAKVDEARMFSSDGALRLTDPSGFEQLSGLADQVGCNFQIVKSDNYRIVAENDGALDTASIRSFNSSQRQLIRRYQQTGNHSMRKPATIPDFEDNLKAYCALVDYILGIMAWWLVRVADSTLWHHQLIAILGRWAVKLKVIAFDPVGSADQSRADAEERMRQLITDLAEKDTLVLPIRSRGNKESVESINVLDEDSDLDSVYYKINIGFRAALELLLLHICSALTSPERSANTPEAFEACTLVYRTGLDQKPTVLTSERSGNISATLHTPSLSYCYPAFQLLFRNTSKAYAESTRQPDLDIASKITPRQRTNVSGVNVAGPFHVDKMDGLVSLLVPLAITSPRCTHIIDVLISMGATVYQGRDRIRRFEPPSPSLDLDYTISTAEWIQRRRRIRIGSFHDPDIVDLSNGPLRFNVRAGTEIAGIMQPQKSDTNRISFAEERTESDTNRTVSSVEQRAERVLADYKNHIKKMSEWVPAQKTITVDCHRYSRSIISAAITLVLSSLAIPFTVGDRIQGVDPFQIVTFMWLVAGFILIVSKSRYVNDWPWHDFLGGRVVCKSIKDLAEISGIDPQMILLYLLNNEFRNTLVFSGPYTGVFERVSKGGDGFVVDVPTKLSTLLAGGLLVFKVLNKGGEHLICMDIRQGARSIVRRGRSYYKVAVDIGLDDYWADTKVEDQGIERRNSDVQLGATRADKVIKLVNRLLNITCPCPKRSNLVVGAVCAPVYIFLLPTLNPRTSQSILKQAEEINFIGIILVIGLIVSIVMAICFGVVQSVSGIVSGLVTGKTGHYEPWYVFAGVFCISGAACLYTVNEFTDLANIYGYEILLGLGSGAATQLTFAVASMKVVPADIGRSTGWEAFVQLGGPTISLSIAQAVFINKTQFAVGSLLPDLTIEEISTIISDPASDLLRGLTEQMQHEVVSDVVNAMRDAYIVCLVGACLVLLLVFRFKVNDKLW